MILIQDSYVDVFFEIVTSFLKELDLDDVLDKFYEFSEKSKEITLNEVEEYIKPVAFVSEDNIKHDDINKKKGGQYIKFRTIPKWHHYAWDMLG